MYCQNLLHVISTIFLYGYIASHGSDFAWAQETNSATSSNDDPYDYRNINGTYAAPVPANITTLWDLIRSRPDLSSLAAALEECGGFQQAFDTNPTWQYTFLAPNNDAFEEYTGVYFRDYADTPDWSCENVSREGKWWIGNIILNHYVPNTILKIANFNETYQRFQTATYLYIGSQVVDGALTLNQVATVVESDLEVTEGIVHIIDRVLDPSSQIYNADIPGISQAFIPGSCSNAKLPYC